MENARNNLPEVTSELCPEKPTIRKQRILLVGAFVVIGLSALTVLWMDTAREMLLAQSSPEVAPEKVSTVFTTARRSFLDGVKEYFLVQPTPVQPIAFNHRIHIQNGLPCAGCHTGVQLGPNAGLPSVSFCMACHQTVATDKPEIKKLTAYADKGEEPPWQPVFWYYPEEHVLFQHAPHIRNGIACEECHGDISKETVAVRSKNLSMNFCLSCHKAKAVSVDCIACHY